MLQHLIRDARLLRAARPGGDNHVGRMKGFDFIDGGFVVSQHAHRACGVELADALDEVVGEGIVIIDEDDHLRSIAEGAVMGEWLMGRWKPGRRATKLDDLEVGVGFL